MGLFHLRQETEWCAWEGFSNFSELALPARFVLLVKIVLIVGFVVIQQSRPRPKTMRFASEQVVRTRRDI